MKLVSTKSGLKLLNSLTIPSEFVIIDYDEITKHNCWDEEITDNFLETGTFFGHGVVSALLRGARNIISIEINQQFYYHNIIKFLLNLALSGQQFTCKTNDNSFSLKTANCNITFINGDTREVMPQALELVNEPTTFWLDAHWGPDINSDLQGNEDSSVLFPIYKEIELIKQHKIKNHKIMIDDMKQYEKYYSSDLTELKNKILEINKDYTFRIKKKESDVDDYIFIAEI